MLQDMSTPFDQCIANHEKPLSIANASSMLVHNYEKSTSTKCEYFDLSCFQILEQIPLQERNENVMEDPRENREAGSAVAQKSRQIN